LVQGLQRAVSQGRRFGGLRIPINPHHHSYLLPNRFPDARYCRIRDRDA
jgi:hypothetical protein